MHTCPMYSRTHTYVHLHVCYSVSMHIENNTLYKPIACKWRLMPIISIQFHTHTSNTLTFCIFYSLCSKFQDASGAWSETCRSTSHPQSLPGVPQCKPCVCSMTALSYYNMIAKTMPIFSLTSHQIICIVGPPTMLHFLWLCNLTVKFIW